MLLHNILAEPDAGMVRRTVEMCKPAMDAASKQGNVLASGIDWVTDELFNLLPWERIPITHVESPV